MSASPTKRVPTDRLKSMGKTLVHLTNAFPFGRGENFAAGEIAHLAEEFDRVLLIPTAPQSNPGAPRPLPDNVHLFESSSLNATSRLGLARYALDGLPQAVRSSKELSRFPLELAFSARTSSVYAHVKKWLEQPHVRELWQGQDITIYATWFHLTASVGLRLRDEFFGDNVRFAASRAHSYDVYHFHNPRRNYLPAREALLNGYDRILPVSQDGVAYLQERFPQHAGKIRLARLGVGGPVGELRPTPRPFTVFSTSTVVPHKRLQLLIDGLKLVASSGREFHWYHIGAPRADASPDFAASVTRYAQENLPASSYTFLGSIPNSEVTLEYQKRGASVFINTSEIEGVPVSIMEAMAVGLPIIATDVGGSRDVFSEEMFNGLLASNPSSGEVAETLIRLHDLPFEGYVAAAEASSNAWDESWNADRNYRAFARGLAEGTL